MYQKKKVSKIRKMTFRFCFFSWIVFCIFYHTGERSGLASSIPHLVLYVSLSFSVFLSLFTRLFQRRLSLDDGVPVEVVLDVVRSEHASHLEVS